MRDTIDILDNIGRDASLRHASAESLAGVLQQAQASQHLKMAVASGDRTLLSGEFGDKTMYMPQVSQVPGHEEEQDDKQEGEDADEPLSQ
jgi:hypothetical protein